MKQHAYLIMAHTDLDLLKLLLKKLDGVNNTFYIHLDKEFKIDAAKVANTLKQSQVHFIK